MERAAKIDEVKELNREARLSEESRREINI